LINNNCETYKSGETHNVLQATKYSQTHQLPYRFLAYRDFPGLIKNFDGINRVLDLGSGTGASTYYLFEKGYDVIGVDKSHAMIREAKLNFPKLYFTEIEKLKSLPAFDLVFSSFVLFELSSTQEIINYLNLASSTLRNDGIFFAVTGSENLHQNTRNWMCFDVNYKENFYPHSGNIVKLGLKELKMEFFDYFWKESDYKECFQRSNLELIQTHYPLGFKEEAFEWKEELFIPPFITFLAKKK